MPGCALRQGPSSTLSTNMVCRVLSFVKIACVQYNSAYIYTNKNIQAYKNIHKHTGTPLIVAHCENACNNVDICVMLIKHGANPDVMDPVGNVVWYDLMRCNGGEKEEAKVSRVD